ncbi:MAG: GlsB/YeaQ/YmgE family stress response membrane protein [Dehalococcoidia bacterium]
MTFIGYILIGLVAGWLAGLLMRGRGFGCIGNVLVGVVGAMIGGSLFRALGLSFGGLTGSLLTALVGAVLLLFVVGLLSKSSR